MRPNRILSFDPGKSPKSFAYSFMVGGTVMRYGLVRPIDSLEPARYGPESQEFFSRIKSLALETSPDVVVAERFQDRGGASKGTTGEHINLMLGLMSAALWPIGLELVQPATWKAWLMRHYSIGKPTKKRAPMLPNMWMFLRQRFPYCWKTSIQNRIVIHEADACAIALWRYETADMVQRYGSIDCLLDRSTVKRAI